MNTVLEGLHAFLSTWNVAWCMCTFISAISVHAQLMSSSFVLLLQNHELCGASDFHSLHMGWGILGADQVWWIKMTARHNIELLGEKRQHDVSNKWSRTGLTYYIVCYFILVYSSSLYYLMIKNLKIHSFWDVIICQLVNNLAVSLGQAVHWTNWLLDCGYEASVILWYTSESVPLFNKNQGA
jgi:hypothetical protein